MNALKALIPRKPLKNINGQLVLITGAGKGLGRSLSERLALIHGARIVAWDVDTKSNEEMTKYIIDRGGKCYPYTVDVSSSKHIHEMADKVRKDLGDIDILVNNAGIVYGGLLLDMPDDQIERQTVINCFSNAYTMKAFLPQMQKKGKGQVVSVASVAGYAGVVRLAAYCASKHAQIGLHNSVQNEFFNDPQCKNIKFTLVCPYFMDTGMFEGVTSWFVPLLKPDRVANETVEGILRESELVMTPPFISFLMRVKLMCPRWFVRWTMKVIGISGAMKHFKGRH